MTHNRFNVSINGQFQRSKRLDSDKLDDGYVLLGTGRQALEIMASNIVESPQRAFTWTGPYGCGKSSLALLLTSLVGAPEDRVRAFRLIGDNELLAKGFEAQKGWKILRVVGRQGALTEDLGALLKCRRTEKAISAALMREAKSVSASDGLLLIIDELGKYLEADCASANTYLLQELAEQACRSERKIVVIGILHQAMDVYASKLPFSVRDEWTKVQGRFLDIPLAATTDETLELLSRAMILPPDFVPEKNFADEVELVTNWLVTNAGFEREHIHALLMKCWPLNPGVSLMLGPVSRRRFSQNERSTYSFLSAIEPAGFAQFLQDEEAGNEYRLAKYFDYLQSNFETAILATPDSHRWLTAVDAITRAENKGSKDLVNLAKTVAIIDLFRSGSRIQASSEILAAAVGKTVEEVEGILKELVAARVVVERRHAHAWAVFAGSDFDLEAAMKEASLQVNGLDINAISHLIRLDPVVARAAYLRTGTMRWFNRRMVAENDLGRLASEKFADDGSCGDMILVLPNAETFTRGTDAKIYLETLYAKHKFDELSKSIDRTFVLGLPVNAETIMMFAQELQTVNIVAKNPQLEGDPTGRNEVNIRRSYIRQNLIDSLSEAFSTALWCSPYGVYPTMTASHLIGYASMLANTVYDKTPRINNELINRDNLSGNVKTARKELLYAMIERSNEERLGFEKFPPAYALYASMLKTLHKRSHNGEYSFLAWPVPDENNLKPLWEATTEFLKTHSLVSVADIYRFWRKAPFGVKDGPMPVLLTAYLLGHSEATAIYVDGTLLSDLEVFVMDRLLVSAKDIEVRFVDPTERHQDLLDAVAAALKPFEPKVVATPLGIGRAIVKTVLTAPAWAQKTMNLSAHTLEMRRATLKASDPIDFVFLKLPQVFGTNDAAEIAHGVKCALTEIVEATPKLFATIKRHLFTVLQVDEDNLEELHKRAEAIHGLSGNMTQEAFVTRMMRFTGANLDMQGLWSLATGKPMNASSDLSLQACISKLDEFAYAFRKQEVFAGLRGRDSSRTVLGITMASGEKDIVKTIEVSQEDRLKAYNKAQDLLSQLKGMDSTMANAVLAELGILINKD